MTHLTPENYNQGFLVDEELMAGVTRDPNQPGVFTAFILRHTTGEYLGYHPFSDLVAALHALNHIQRAWTFERISGCGGGACKGGGCGGGGCKVGQCGTGSC